MASTLLPEECRGQPGDLLIMVNGQPRPMPAGSTVRDVVAALGWEGRPLAVEINEQVVPRAECAGRSIRHGDRLEIVTFVGGG